MNITSRAMSLEVWKSRMTSTKWHKARWHHVVTQQESSRTSGSSSPPTSNTSPLQALNLTEPWAAGWFSADLHTEMFRQWMTMCCTASELSRCRKFSWTRPTLIVGCSNNQNRCLLRSLVGARVHNVYLTKFIILKTLLMTLGLLLCLKYLGCCYWF